MIEFSTLSIRNFLSYGNAATVIDLHNPGTTLIVGENLDDTTNGEGSNGTGKSVLINALTYALYDKAVSDIAKDNLINNQNKANMEVTVTFRKDDMYYYVRRCRKITKTKPSGTFVQLFERKGDVNFTDSDEVTLDSGANTNARIEAILGIPYELFVRIIVFSAMHVPFLDLPSRTQIDIVEGLVGLRILTEKANVLKEQAKDTDQQILFEEKDLEYKAQIQNDHLRELQLAKQRVVNWEIEHENKIKAAEAKLTELANIDFSREAEIHEQLTKIQQEMQTIVAMERDVQDQIQTVITRRAALQKKIVQNQQVLEMLAGIDFPKEQRLHEEKRTLEFTLKDLSQQEALLKTNLKTLVSEHDKLIAETEHLEQAKCPYCHQNMPDARKRLKSVKDTIEEKETKMQVEEKQFVKVRKDVHTAMNKLEKVTSEITVDNIQELTEAYSRSNTIQQQVDSDTQELTTIENEISKLTERGASLKQQSTDLLDKNNKIKQQAITKDSAEVGRLQGEANQIARNLKELKAATNAHLEHLESLEAREVGSLNYDKINNLRQYSAHQKFLIKILTKKDSFVRKALLEKHLEYLNKRLHVYLRELGLPHNVEFTNNLTARITEFDHVLDFGNLSNGQKARLNLALSLAFRDYLQSVHSQINVCLFDEVLDVGLDPIGVQLAAKVIQRKAHEEKSSLYIISHRDEITHSFDHRMVVTMQKGFSYVRNEF